LVLSQIICDNIPDDDRVAAETYVGLIEQKYENKSAFVGFKKTEN
jgi:hypothetical protein